MAEWRRARQTGRTDQNQKDIVSELRKIFGKSNVQVGHDDILVGTGGRTYWYEIKAPGKRNARKESQKILDTHWTGHRKTVESTEEILADIAKNR